MDKESSSSNRVLDFLKQRWLSIVLLIIALVFIFQNQQEVNVHFLGFTLAWPMWLTLIVILLVGFLIGFLRTRKSKKN